jgi:phage/plasmid primase-like uncharacterized protein
LNLAREVAARLGKATRREGRGWRTTCPVHGGVSLNVADGDAGRLLVTCWAGCDPLHVLAALRDQGFLRDDGAAPVRREMPRTPRRPDPEASSTEALAAAIWYESRDPHDTLVERYLGSRRLALPPRTMESIRFHPRCPFKGERAPAMVALLTNIATGAPSGIHRTALLPDGTDRDRELGKAMLGRAAGAVVRLWPDDEIEQGLGISEGIETGLAIAGAGWRPIWAAVSAGGIARFPVLAGLELTIFGDRDPNGVGQRAARECASRWADAGAAATIRTPHVGDWADLVRPT